MYSQGANPYELLGLSIEATEQEIKTAYRQISLKVHPDRNRGNPDAVRKFHELQRAQERLLDPLEREKLDGKLRGKEAQKARHAKYDAKRKELVEELEERERKLKKARVCHEAEKERLRENERIMEEGRQLREQHGRDMRKKGQEREALRQRVRQEANAGVEPPPSGPLDTTVRVKYTLSSRPTLVNATSIAAVLTPFGAVDESCIVLSLQSAPPKKPKRAIALVPFTRIESAFAAVCASERAEHGLQDIEVTWASRTEPEPIRWLKKMGRLEEAAQDKPLPSTSGQASIPTSGLGIPASDEVFSSFSPTFPDLDAAPQRSNAPTVVPGLDYESLS